MKRKKRKDKRNRHKKEGLNGKKKNEMEERNVAFTLSFTLNVSDKIGRFKC